MGCRPPVDPGSSVSTILTLETHSIDGREESDKTRDLT